MNTEQMREIITDALRSFDWTNYSLPLYIANSIATRQSMEEPAISTGLVNYEQLVRDRNTLRNECFEKDQRKIELQTKLDGVYNDLKQARDERDIWLRRAEIAEKRADTHEATINAIKGAMR